MNKLTVNTFLPSPEASPQHLPLPSPLALLPSPVSPNSAPCNPSSVGDGVGLDKGRIEGTVKETTGNIQGKKNSSILEVQANGCIAHDMHADCHSAHDKELPLNPEAMTTEPFTQAPVANEKALVFNYSASRRCNYCGATSTPMVTSPNTVAARTRRVCQLVQLLRRQGKWD
jgi:hypothetical protein